MLDPGHADLIRKGYEAFSAGDLDSLAQLIADDAVWHVPGGGLASGEHEGKDAVLAMFRQIIEETDGTFRAEVIDVSAHGGHAVALTQMRASFKGRELDAVGAAVFHVRDGRITEMWSLRPEVRRGGELLSSEGARATAT